MFGNWAQEVLLGLGIFIYFIILYIFLSALMLNAFNEIKDLLLSTAQENAFCWTSDRLASAIARGAVSAAKAKFKED